MSDRYAELLTDPPQSPGYPSRSSTHAGAWSLGAAILVAVVDCGPSCC